MSEQNYLFKVSHGAGFDIGISTPSTPDSMGEHLHEISFLSTTVESDIRKRRPECDQDTIFLPWEQLNNLDQKLDKFLGELAKEFDIPFVNTDSDVI